MSSPNVKLATFNLNQWALDFDGNLERVKESIRQAKAAGCRFRLGPELELTGYGCEDHFYEVDTYVHAWESVVALMQGDLTDGILCDVGLPIIHNDVAYNCRLYICNRKLLAVRPKMFLANDGNYRETRWFSGWSEHRDPEAYYLPQAVLDAFPDHAPTIPIGIVVIKTKDATIGCETCEELFTPDAPHITMGLDGVDIFTNGSGSHHQLRKLSTRINLMSSATSKSGGVYMYANQLGCDGGRLFYDGCCMVWMNGRMLAQGSQFGMCDVEMRTAVVNLSDVRSYRMAFKSRSVQAAQSTKRYPRVEVDFALSPSDKNERVRLVPSVPREAFIHDPMEEIAYGPSSWLWDYLRRSGMRGYFLPLSGGADSSSTAMLVGIMCRRVYEHTRSSDPVTRRFFLDQLRRITKEPKGSEWAPASPQHICERLFHTCYMASKFSGDETRRRAVELSKLIGARHYSIVIDDILAGIQQSWGQMQVHPTHPSAASAAPSGRQPAPSMDGCASENLALQNIQARSRMVMAYYLAQLLPWQNDIQGHLATDPDLKDRPTQMWPGSLLVLGSANVDEALRGYYTKYDCSAADINPIGGIRKSDLKQFLLWAHETIGKEEGNNVLHDVAVATPSAELTGTEGEQKDEDDMGMSYTELRDLGAVRKIDSSGPLSTFEKLYHEWSNGIPVCDEACAQTIGAIHRDPQRRTSLPPGQRRELTGSRRRPEVKQAGYAEEVAQKVKDFYFYNAINRHKMTTLTPSYHAENYSPDDNRFDLRPFLYPAAFTRQFRAIDDRVREIKSAMPH
eukprot:TRINITY_DN6442_c0_g1_i1.p1 TRINITY_DN6442_c0_g1~~TRINITY_DN6442_c0_g1_i1.p1  ORF type:complete len:815 (+),score=314.39 TRINITY_DN6442_c0_g1_i1:72-2447(+)